ncbi:MAG: FtsX-like permease family protein [Pirellulales bacterium]|nr:FtsX-like permease family protein [Pirellulales bacterium]
MYKLLLCLRYLRTRYIAMASIISVMLGVATMIVVNSVMSGFSAEMQTRIKGVYSDLAVRSRCVNGFPDAEWHMEFINKIAGDSIEAMTPTVEIPAMIDIRYGHQWVSQPVRMIGIDAKTQALVSDVGKYMQHPKNREQLTWELHHGGYDVRSPSAGPDAPDRPQMALAGWEYRRTKYGFEQDFERPNEARSVEPSPALRSQPLLEPQSPPEPEGLKMPELPPPGADLPAPADEAFNPKLPISTDVLPPPAGAPETPVQRTGSGDPFFQAAPTNVFDPCKKQHTGAVIGIALCTTRDSSGEDTFYALPGDDVILTFPKNIGNGPPEVTHDNYTLVDLIESKMSEFDGKLVFVPIEQLQKDRGMIDPQSGKRFVNSIQIKLKPGVDGASVRDRLAKGFDENPRMRGLYYVGTWKDQQGPLLAAVQMETAILNVLLFLIIAVAGFGILATFLMIVVEKTRDIGVLKSLGASRRGIMGIFLGYGLSLGLVGSVAGMVLGLWFVKEINWLADLLGRVTGQPVFDPSIYYFYKIPTLVDPWTVGSIVLGALAIAVLASILPAMRAALLHPVEALRHE